MSLPFKMIYSPFLLSVMCIFLVAIPSVMSTLKSFDDNQVVPDVIAEAPASLIKVTYGRENVSEGNELTPRSVKDIPAVEWEVESKALYTLCMTDPDAPSRKNPSRREFLHWLVVNIPGNKVHDGQILAEYVGSGPPKGTGLHRYVFLVYKQPGTVRFEEKKISKRSKDGRPGFSIAKFAAKYSLGKPIAGNFYQAQYDDYVPTVHKQLG